MANYAGGRLSYEQQEELNEKLYNACEEGHTEEAVQLIADRADVDYCRGFSLLGIASLKGHMDTVQQLLAHNASINKRDRYESTAFLRSCWGGDIQIVKLLYDSGADVKAIDDWGRTAVHCGCISGNIELVQFLLSLGFSLQDTDKVILIKNVSSSRGDTVMHYTSTNGHFELLKWLMSQGISLTTTNAAGETCIFRACSGGHQEVIKFLLSQGLSFDSQNKRGETPMDKLKIQIWDDAACKERKKKCLDYLQDKDKSAESSDPLVPDTSSKPVEKDDQSSGPSDEQRKNKGAKPQMTASDLTVQPTTVSPSPTPKKRLNRKMIDEYKLKIDNLTQEHKFAHAKGIIFVVGIFGADGTAEDVENITSTFKELKFAVFSERDLTAEKIACLVAAAAECEFPYKYRYIAFYFAGHGGIDESGEPFIRGLQTDASKKENLPIYDFIVTPWKGLQLTRLFFFDCCQSAGSGTVFRGDNDVIKKKPKRYPGEVVALASNTGKKASGNVTSGGVWTHYLCKNLRKPQPITTVLALTFEDVCKVQKDFQEPVSHATIGALVLCEDAVEQKDIDPKKIMMKIPDTEDVIEALEGVTALSVEFRNELKVSNDGDLEIAIKEWKNKEIVEPTWKELITALIKSGNPGVARRVRYEYLMKPEVYKKYSSKPDYKPIDLEKILEF